MLQKLLKKFSSKKPVPHSQRAPDDEWLTLQFDAARAKEKYGVVLPPMPDDETQVGFTALSGEQNMRQAYAFYSYAVKACELEKVKNLKVLDFGGGWGRVARLFLKDTKPGNIFIAETRQSVIDLHKRDNTPFVTIHNTPRPPIPNLPGQLDLVIAYSVFSHLSEPYFLEWTNYFFEILKPGGHIVFTSRGHYFIDHLKRLHAQENTARPELAEHIRRLKQMMPAPSEISRRFESGEFQFYPIGGSGELTPDFFGEAFIPKDYLERRFPGKFVSYVEDLPHVDQSVIVLRKN